jgi:hypothetical protein
MKDASGDSEGPVNLPSVPTSGGTDASEEFLLLLKVNYIIVVALHNELLPIYNEFIMVPNSQNDYFVFCYLYYAKEYLLSNEFILSNCISFIVFYDLCVSKYKDYET